MSYHNLFKKLEAKISTEAVEEDLVEEVVEPTEPVEEVLATAEAESDPVPEVTEEPEIEMEGDEVELEESADQVVEEVIAEAESGEDQVDDEVVIDEAEATDDFDAGIAEGEEEVLEDDPTDLTDIEEGVVEETAEIEGEAADIEEHFEATDEAEAELEDLDEVQSSLDEAVEVGAEDQIDDVALEMIHARLRYIHNKFGIVDKTHVNAFAKENFQGAVTRKASIHNAQKALRIAREGMLETIGNASKAGLQKLKDFFAKTFKTVRGLELKIKEARERVNKLQGDPVENGSKNAGHLSVIFRGDASPDRIVKMGKNQVAVTKSAIKTIETVYKYLDKAEDKPTSELDLGPLNKELSFGSEDKPLVGGFYITVSEGKKKKHETPVTKDGVLVPGDKGELLEVLDTADAVLNSLKDAGDKFSKLFNDLDNKRLNGKAKETAETSKSMNKSTVKFEDGINLAFFDLINLDVTFIKESLIHVSKAAKCFKAKKEETKSEE